MPWLDVIQCISGITAIGASKTPCVKDLLPKLVLRTAFRDQLRFVDLMIHAAPELAGLQPIDQGYGHLTLLIPLGVQ